MNSDDLNYKKLELLDQDWFPRSRLAKTTLMIFRIGEFLLNIFAPVDDIHIWQKVHKTGEITFYVRERSSGQRWQFNSEAELRIWLEKRHHLSKHQT